MNCAISKENGLTRHLYFCQCTDEVLVVDVINDPEWPIISMSIWESRHRMPGFLWRIRQAWRIMTGGTIDADNIVFERKDLDELIATLQDAKRLIEDTSA